MKLIAPAAHLHRVRDFAAHALPLIKTNLPRCDGGTLFFYRIFFLSRVPENQQPAGGGVWQGCVELSFSFTASGKKTSERGEMSATKIYGLGVVCLFWQMVLAGGRRRRVTVGNGHLFPGGRRRRMAVRMPGSLEGRGRVRLASGHRFPEPRG